MCHDIKLKYRVSFCTEAETDCALCILENKNLGQYYTIILCYVCTKTLENSLKITLVPEKVLPLQVVLLLLLLLLLVLLLLLQLVLQ